jgi:alanine-glyoxylate transaminase/serine-glyoxylate transaminase/serine-pyruvate transaminase
MGPGPSDADPRLLRAMATPLIGHLDPEFIVIMDETKELLRYLFQTENELTIPISGTGSAGMETCFCNLLEPDDEVIVCVNGVFGQRMCDVADRCGAKVIRVEAHWGEIIQPDKVAEALSQSRAKVVAIVHAETSTGVLQPLEEIASLAHEHGALFLVDAVTSLGGVPVEVDKWGIDACYSGTQKCISCPPGLAPVTFNQMAMNVLNDRKTKVQSWYLDLTMIGKYWGSDRAYHHTAPITMNYALREALRFIHEEGLEARFSRHERNSRALIAGLKAMGVHPLVPLEHRLASLNAVRIPDGVNDAEVRRRLLQEMGIEIGGGLGELKGQIWRIGLMGYSSQRRNVLLLLAALECILTDEGLSISSGSGVQAANEILEGAA